MHMAPEHKQTFKRNLVSTIWSSCYFTFNSMIAPNTESGEEEEAAEEGDEEAVE